ncbi:MAG: hypothetical protein KDA24_01115 [Deltaproteobacteria bacterium]|nr:hypothetical protein [Deltaproteobacteria bacterium]
MSALPPPLQRRFVDAGGREHSSLLGAVGPEARFDPQGVTDLLAWGHPVGPHTVFASISWADAPPWLLPAPSPHPSELGPDARADALWDLLCEAVARRPAGEVGAALSGGLDSRAVALALREGQPAAQCFTFGDSGAVDLGRARLVARRLGLRHLVSALPLDAALLEERRVFEATGGLGGPAAAPGAFTDRSWSGDIDVLLSGMSGDVIWGDTALRGPGSASRLRKLGAGVASDPVVHVPPAPPWATPAGVVAWQNLWTRQARVTWNGILPRLAYTAVVPVCWDPELLSFCLALDGVDRNGRALLRRMLARHGREVDPEVVPGVTGPVHDLDRAMSTSPAWRRELDHMIGGRERWDALGLRPRGVARILRLVRDGKRARSGLVSRLRVLWMWGERLGLGSG